MARSLRSHLLAWLLGPLALLLAFNIALTLANAHKTAAVVNDRMLLGSARMIGQHVSYEDGLLEAEIPPAALELFQSGAGDEIFYRIARPDGRLVAGYTDLPGPPHRPEPDAAVYYDATVRGNAVRVVAYAQPVFGAPDDWVLIEVADTLRASGSLAQAIASHTLWQQAVLVALATLLGLASLRRAIAPLLRLRSQVLGRPAGTLEPLDTRRVPSELRSLADALNDYVGRLAQHMSAHRRFIGNAAHQLRTPLALLNTQAEYALGSADPESRELALSSMRESIRHSNRVVNQLLTLSVAEDGTPPAASGAEVDVRAVVRRVVEEMAPMAQSKAMDLGFEGPPSEARVRADPAMLKELVVNLVDNALRYTPRGGRVTACVEIIPGAVELRVEDDGPGIPEAERERVFERFYRLTHEVADGCGLGLAIVREIAATSGASVTLRDGPAGKGLAAIVRFPASAQRDASTNSVV